MDEGSDDDDPSHSSDRLRDSVGLVSQAGPLQLTYHTQVLQRDLRDSVCSVSACRYQLNHIQVLQRDGGKCILTGRFDLITYYHRLKLDLKAQFTEMQVSHIFKRSVALYSYTGEAKKASTPLVVHKVP